MMMYLYPAVGVLLCAATASAQLIRPDSATATSEFSGSYDIGNTIDGSGLPVNFALTDPHATYAANNHWTTQANHTLGESATFSFNNAQTLGAFHMWNHRSNGIANNPYYEPVRFDLALFSGPGATGTQLLLLTDVAAESNIAVAQTFPFNTTAGVRSVRFTVRATENGNVSPYTGLAEVAFGPCVPAEVRQAGRPASVPACPLDTASFAVVPYGSGPFNYQWQWRTDASAPWVNVAEGANPATGTPVFTAVGSTLQGLVAFPVGEWSTAGAISFRVSATNQCGSVFSPPAALVIDPADVGVAGGVPGRDGVYDNNDFVVFIDYFFGADPKADLGSAGGVFGADGVFDNNDFVVFIDRFFTPCP
jgi:hypothetical protein